MGIVCIINEPKLTSEGKIKRTPTPSHPPFSERKEGRESEGLPASHHSDRTRNPQEGKPFYESQSSLPRISLAPAPKARKKGEKRGTQGTSLFSPLAQNKGRGGKGERGKATTIFFFFLSHTTQPASITPWPKSP
jgi:hypothetical protein